MYAIIETGSKQYRVQAGDIIQTERLKKGSVGSSVQFSDVLFVSDGKKNFLGKPHVQNAKVSAEVVGSGRGKKIVVFKYRRRKDSRSRKGHRQPMTQLLITGIESGGSEKKTLAAPEKKKILEQFHSSLKAAGPAQTQKTLGSRVRRRGGPEKVLKAKAAKKAKQKKQATASTKSKKSGKKSAKKGSKKGAKNSVKKSAKAKTVTKSTKSAKATSSSKVTAKKK